LAVGQRERQLPHADFDLEFPDGPRTQQEFVV
jgi:hypothetical protein